MLNVENKKCINNLSNETLKANKMRNLFAIIAITLTCILFTSLFTIGGSVLTSMEEATMRQVGGSAHGSFKYLSPKEYDVLKEHKSIKQITYSVVLSTAENEELKKRSTEIRYISGEDGAQELFSNPTTGKLPQNKNEVATDTIILEKLGVSARIGENIELEYILNGEKVKETFTLVGFWEGDPLANASMLWLDKDYVEEKLMDYVPGDKFDYTGLVMADVVFANSLNIENKIRKIITDSGFDTNQIQYGVNWAYMGGNEIDILIVIGTIFIMLIIIFCGYLMISNIFFISISKDIREFGLLKTLGFTGKQIKKIIRKQAIHLCLVGTPIGLVCGYIIGSLLTPVVMSVMTYDGLVISTNPFIFIVSILFTMLTVFLSISKPAKIASKVSPIEALRNSDNTNSKRKFKKGSKVNLLKMAHHNVTRNFKKFIMVIISLSLSLIIINVTFSYANGFDVEKYLRSSILNDFSVGDLSNFNVNIRYGEQDTLNKELLTELKKQDGIEFFNEVYFTQASVAIPKSIRDLLPEIKENELGSGEWLEYVEQILSDQDALMTLSMYGLSDELFEELEFVSGTIDLEKLKTGDYVIASHYDYEGTLPYYNVGDKVSLPKPVDERTSLSDSLKNMKEYEVMAVAQIPYPLSIKSTTVINPNFYLPKDIFLADIVQKEPMLVTLDVEDKSIPGMTDFLENYINVINNDLDFQSRETIVMEYENIQKSYKLVGLVLSGILAFIGIMNFVNTNLTSISARKREFATLQSIGMTNSQVTKLLIFEGLWYTAFAMTFTFTIGILLGKLVMVTLSVGSPYQSSYFTAIPALLCLPILIIITVLIPYLTSKNISKQTIVERLRLSE